MIQQKEPYHEDEEAVFSERQAYVYTSSSEKRLKRNNKQACKGC